MEKTLELGEGDAERKSAENDFVKVPADNMEMEETTGVSPGSAGELDKAEEERAERPSPDGGREGGENVCKVCGFSTMYPRSLKTHYTRKHGKVTEKNPPPDEEKVNNLNASEVQEQLTIKTEEDDGEQNQSPDLDQEETNMAQERRVSKRTPKPKIIYSCNYCGHEFRDKAPLDVHIQRYHAKDVPLTFEVEENVGESEEAVESCSTEKASPSKVAPKRVLSRFQLKCPICDFRVGSTAVLERHTRDKHPTLEWLRCKVCNFFAATSEWMSSHLSSDGHLEQQKVKKSSEASSFEQCVEKVSRDCAGEDAVVGHLDQVVPGEGTTLTKDQQKADELSEAAESVLTEEEDAELEPPRKKRGRPKQGSSTTCGYCGLVVSNATNLSVHVRRKHSKDYGYSCTLCNYSCVTKGDMDRHCFTKKHVKRAQESSSKSPARADSGAPLLEPTSAPDAGTQPTDARQEQDGELLGEHKDQDQTESDTSQQKSKYDSVNACSLCDFVAQSIPSLHLHVKRKHTKDFEYVCLACSYYAVTSREMYRHASTEKHKQKSQKYLEHQKGKEQRASEHPLKETEINEPPGQNSSTGCEHPNPSDWSGSCYIDSPCVEMQDPAAPSVTTEIVRVVVGGTGGEDEMQVTTNTSSADNEPESTSRTAEMTVQQASAELHLPLDESAHEENQNLEGTQAREETSKEDAAVVDMQMSKAPPFDASIVSFKALAEQEVTLTESMALEGEAPVISLTGGPISSVTSPSSTYVRKLKPKEMKVRDEAKACSSRIRCEDCGFMADGLSGLNVHISMKHPSKERHFHCLVCGKSFYTESNLHQHLSSAAHLRNEQNSVEELPEGGASFKCVKCTDRFETEQDLFVHIKEKHEELLREVNKYVLEDTEQINREREENQGSVCKYCGKVCKSSNSMAFLAHIRTHTGSKPFMCKICNFATAQLGDARNHVKRHLGMREYKCDICGWAFVMKKHLNTHLLGKHGVGQRKERKFECELCDRSFSEKWALNNHMKLHNGEKPYKCIWPSCHYAFLNLSAMKDHYRTHTGEKSYLCDLCGFAGGTRHALTKHRRQHTGERPFKCKLCNFASTTQSHLSRHKRVHTGEKPYRCPWCDYRSNCAENIRKHILHTGKHEGVKMYNCPKCTFATNSPMEFRNHLKDNHLDIENPDLAYLHAGIVSKSFECRLKGQGATFVEAESVESPEHRKGSSESSSHEEAVQQVIIIQGYGEEDMAIDQALEESAAATLQTLAMAGQVAEVLHITEDGQVIASGREVASAGAHLAGGSTQYVVVESGDARKDLHAAAGQSHIVSESSTALDALLTAVSEMGHQEKVQGEATVVHEVLAPEASEGAHAVMDVKQEEQEEVQVIQEAGHENMQEVLKLAASQMMKEGLTQVIVNDEGTHYIVTELEDCTLQVEEAVYGGAAAGDGEAQQAEQQAGEEMVVYLDGASHNIVLEG
ncbi:zinc finger protein 407 [Poecilia formosa]|uniref:Zinc finger protein 407 n=3 Tax=Poecilia TaxID=8080 RepID=A0A087YMD3_POEFO|nr:PREDICTED: zinc finger protein 407 [Poecilia formosa]